MWKLTYVFVKIVLVVNKGGRKMIGYLLGILGFLLLFVFDLLSMNYKRKSKYLFMVLGVVSLIVGTILIIRRDTSFILPSSVRILFGVMTIPFLLLLIYSVVIEVGKNTYQYNNTPKLITTGTYALSRHPGVLWLFGLYLSLSFTFAHTGLLVAAFLFTVVNTLYVYIQEKLIFIHIFDDYRMYQSQTPFIIPNSKSLKAFIYNKQMKESTK
jgi:protein-S-isoprenylcysteine O-methyltransferase Ste14